MNLKAICRMMCGVAIFLCKHSVKPVFVGK